jgi:hypothetical protein
MIHVSDWYQVWVCADIQTTVKANTGDHTRRMAITTHTRTNNINILLKPIRLIHTRTMPVHLTPMAMEPAQQIHTPTPVLLIHMLPERQILTLKLKLPIHTLLSSPILISIHIRLIHTTRGSLPATHTVDTKMASALSEWQLLRHIVRTATRVLDLLHITHQSKLLSLNAWSRIPTLVIY